MSNYYHNMTRLLDITDSKESLMFYQRSIDYSKIKDIINQKEYLKLLTQIKKVEAAIS